MTSEQILTKAIQKAIDGGWDVDLETVLPEMSKMWSLYGLQYVGYSGLLFSHDFARALWGGEQDGVWDGEWRLYMARSINETPRLYYLPAWQYHLQQMVVADDPIAYLGENI